MLSKKEIMEYVQGRKDAGEKKLFTLAEAERIGNELGIPWDKFGVEQFRMGLNHELEHGRRDPATDVTHDQPAATGKLALAHLNEIPDYYTHLAAMEHETERAKSTPQQGGQ
jgi:hypothetical protein